MRIIEGTNVDLISPFPAGEVGRMYGWMHCYRTVTEDDDSPQTLEEFCRHTHQMMGVCPSWGIVDKWKITNTRHEAPLVGVLMFEPNIHPWSGQIRSGQLHVATARKAWKTGLVDEAAKQVIGTLFKELPGLLRLNAVVLEKNYPAKGLARRVGFKFEGLLEDSVVQSRSPQNLAWFGLTRRNYELCQVSLTSQEYLEHSAVSQGACLDMEGQTILAPLVEAPQEPRVELAPQMDKPQLLEARVV